MSDCLCSPHWDIKTASARVDELEAENDALREALRDLLMLRQAQADGVSGQYPNFAGHERDAWKLAADLTRFEDGP